MDYSIYLIFKRRCWRGRQEAWNGSCAWWKTKGHESPWSSVLILLNSGLVVFLVFWRIPFVDWEFTRGVLWLEKFGKALSQLGWTALLYNVAWLLIWTWRLGSDSWVKYDGWTQRGAMNGTTLDSLLDLNNFRNLIKLWLWHKNRPKMTRTFLLTSGGYFDMKLLLKRPESNNVKALQNLGQI